MVPHVITFVFSASTNSYSMNQTNYTFNVNFIRYWNRLVNLCFRSVPSFQAVNQVLHVLFIFLPFFWLIGLLPPIDSLALWIAEQCLVFGFGGSPCATDLRLHFTLVRKRGRICPIHSQIKSIILRLTFTTFLFDVRP